MSNVAINAYPKISFKWVNQPTVFQSIESFVFVYLCGADAACELCLYYVFDRFDILSCLVCKIVSNRFE